MSRFNNYYNIPSAAYRGMYGDRGQARDVRPMYGAAGLGMYDTGRGRSDSRRSGGIGFSPRSDPPLRPRERRPSSWAGYGRSYDQNPAFGAASRGMYGRGGSREEATPAPRHEPRSRSMHDTHGAQGATMPPSRYEQPTVPGYEAELARSRPYANARLANARPTSLRSANLRDLNGAKGTDASFAMSSMDGQNGSRRSMLSRASAALRPWRRSRLGAWNQSDIDAYGGSTHGSSRTRPSNRTV